MKKSLWRSLLNSPKAVPYFFVAPFVLSFLLFYLYPFIATIQMSFQRIAGFGDVTFIGWSNYGRLLNEHFFNALRTTSQYTFWTILVLVPLPILLAVLVNHKRVRFTGFFKSALFIPALTSVIVAGIFFRYSFGEQATTLANAVTGLFGMKPITWLQIKGPAMFALVLLCTWRWLGVNMVYFLSGLQGISQELYEAAEIDGAGAWDRFRCITLPGLKPVIIYVITISVYGGFSMFAESYAFWKTATPGDIGMTIVSYIYQMGFNNFDMGFASAIGITLVILVMLVNLIQLTCFGFFKKDSD
ncbi:arabinosaccharide transport system permease protein [Hydrogenispora ethanolica]|uniref:Arabinosaccharide transport system permease protein n=1 Tax=Hydrogenispora ethanolica TaxID=1082276 RepID=A0A4R1SDP6_HYDET|nr:sugar ABC transporter permease [Hydrogenispora ethanolica]TCL76772.1 arabinosaccharide transport system permease protein [Hydrogenispora ethanolica]